jgi:enterochelin esterase-like enzyme
MLGRRLRQSTISVAKVKRRTLPAPSPEVRQFAAGAVVAALVLMAAVVSGSVDSSNATLQLMGFDPDRSQLITALAVSAVAAAASALVTGRIASATLLGTLGSAALFGGTFMAETQAAMRSPNPAGAFDPGGWSITLITLAASALVASWAGAALATTARPALFDALRMVGWIAGWIFGRLVTLAVWLPLPRLARAKVAVWARLATAWGSSGRRGRRSAVVQPRILRRAGLVTLVAVVLGVAVPVFGDLVNYSPDSHMLHGGPQLAGLGGPATSDALPPNSQPTLPGGGTLSTSPMARPAAPLADPRPWLAWRPSGGGHVVSYHLPAPWRGGSATQVEVAVYTPPGYHSNGSLRYPTLYEVPWNVASWQKAVDLAGALDTLIDSGGIPPTIVLFVDAGIGPYPDSECANSYDGRQWYDRFVAQTVVPWVDSHYRTIVQPAARAIMGMSQGGYCAAILALHHPDVFGTSISFSGYFHAGVVGDNSARPFGGNQQALNAGSPDVVVGQLARPIRTSLYFIVIAQPSQALYGSQADQFNRLLAVDGYPHLAIAAAEPHGWVQVRQDLAPVLAAWASRLVATGVF